MVAAALVGKHGSEVAVGATLREVAERAGVSVRTVSNVVNDYEHVSAETRSRVRKALDDLGYQPNPLARSLRRGRSGLVGLVIPELDVPYFAELSKAILHEARSLGLTVVVDQTEGDLAREREIILHGRGSALYDAVIASPVALSLRELRTRKVNTPLVLLGERIAPGSGFDLVRFDNISAAREATQHLLALGRRRIAAVGESRTAPATTAHLRTQGYRQALEAAGLPYDPDLVVSTRYLHRSDGAQACERLLSHAEPPDALFCYNDLLALGAQHAAQSKGVRVPDDLAVIGMDDIEDGRFSTPALTTIGPDKTEIGRRAVELLQRRLAGEDSPAQTVEVGYQLVVRRSAPVPTS